MDEALVEEIGSERIDSLQRLLKVYRLKRDKNDKDHSLHYHFESSLNSDSHQESSTVGLINPTEYHPVF